MASKQIKVIWGLSKALGMEKEDVYAVLYRETGKEGMTACSEKELSRTVQALVMIKEQQLHRPGMITRRQLYKIHELEQALGWSDNDKRLQAFVKKYYHVASLDWLTLGQAIKLIDSLKNVLEKEQDKAEEDKAQHQKAPAKVEG